jgi:hypothetical protein
MEDNLASEDEETERLRTARMMNKRCGILKSYTGFNTWESKETGEVEPLLQPDETVDMWRKANYNLS